VDKKSASQHQDQDNLCYRGDDCEQANQGQQIVGENNDAKGFNDQSDNLQALPSIGAGAGAGEGNGTTPTPSLCVICFTAAFAGLNSTEIATIVAAVGGSGSSIQSLCDLPVIDEDTITPILLGQGVSQATITALIECLIAAGVNVIPGG
jgi:hypothetical protein